jgi:sorbitol/mannitol transport system substrate-binding protein
MNNYGPPGASNNGFNENLALFQQGKCGMWIDATVAASFVTGKDSTVADKVGFALAPDKGLGKRGNWLWAWSLAIPAGSQKVDAAKKFVAWATGKEYIELVAAKEGWANVPPGTRTSLYDNPEYQKIPFAKMTLDSINAADPTHPTVEPKCLTPAFSSSPFRSSRASAPPLVSSSRPHWLERHRPTTHSRMRRT